MNRVTFHVGQTYTKDGGLIKDLQSRRIVAFSILGEEFAGFTCLPGVGGWRNPQSKAIVLEDCWAMSVYVGEVGGRKVENVAKRLRDLFEQEEVFVTIEDGVRTLSV